MTRIGPHDVRRLYNGSIDVDYYIARARRCRARAMGAAVDRVLAFFGLRKPAAPPPEPMLPALAGGAARSSKSCPPRLESDDGRQHDDRADASGYLG